LDTVGKFKARLDDYKVGDKVRLSILRDGGKMDAELILQPGI
jgi:hypothetical protein